MKKVGEPINIIDISTYWLPLVEEAGAGSGTYKDIHLSSLSTSWTLNPSCSKLFGLLFKRERRDRGNVAKARPRDRQGYSWFRRERLRDFSTRDAILFLSDCLEFVPFSDIQMIPAIDVQRLLAGFLSWLQTILLQWWHHFLHWNGSG